VQPVPRRNRWGVTAPVTIGGAPRWIQAYASWPRCARCRARMFFVARVRAIEVPPTAGCGDQDLYAFVCAACRRLALTMQNS
jgi:hypothetical protein